MNNEEIILLGDASTEELPENRDWNTNGQAEECWL